MFPSQVGLLWGPQQHRPQTHGPPAQLPPPKESPLPILGLQRPLFQIPGGAPLPSRAPTAWQVRVKFGVGSSSSHSLFEFPKMMIKSQIQLGGRGRCHRLHRHPGQQPKVLHQEWFFFSPHRFLWYVGLQFPSFMFLLGIGAGWELNYDGTCECVGLGEG